MTLLSSTKLQHFKRLLESRIADAQRAISAAEQEIRAASARQADAADQGVAEYERQTLAYRASAARQTVRQLTHALERIRQKTFGECAECGNEIEAKRLEAIPWARYCRSYQELKEHQ
jgi:RNA polymerase-binding transcription factor